MHLKTEKNKHINRKKIWLSHYIDIDYIFN